MNKPLANEPDDSHLTEQQIEGTQVFRGALLDVRCDRVALPEGKEGTREYIVHQGAAVIIPILDNGDLIFERQYRYPLGRVFLELPAGKIDPGETALATAKRELLEETGYAAREWRHVGTTHPCVGYSNERIEVFVARGLTLESQQRLDHGEKLDVLTMTLDKALEAVRCGQISDGKTMTCVFWAEKILRYDW